MRDELGCRDARLRPTGRIDSPFGIPIGPRRGHGVPRSAVRRAGQQRQPQRLRPAGGPTRSPRSPHPTYTSGPQPTATPPPKPDPDAAPGPVADREQQPKKEETSRKAIRILSYKRVQSSLSRAPARGTAGSSKACPQAGRQRQGAPRWSWPTAPTRTPATSSPTERLQAATARHARDNGSLHLRVPPPNVLP